MGKYIIKLNDGEKDYYLEYSSVVDAPTSFGMSLEEFKEFYRDEYGREGFDRLEQRLKRVEEKGTSEHNADNVDDTIGCNRAGKRETRLTKQQIIEVYCKQSVPEGSIEGFDWLAAAQAEEKAEEEARGR